jgi:exopolysaccharide biosynthesis polyprenyl glycosylphosphotransferase
VSVIRAADEGREHGTPTIAAATLESPLLRERPGMNRPIAGLRARGRRVSPLHSRRVLVRATLVSADLLALAVAFAVTQALWIEFGPAANDHRGLVSELLLFFVMLPVWPMVAALYGLYRRDDERTDHSTADELVTVFHLLTVGTWLFLLAAVVTHWAHPDPVKLCIFWAVALALLSLGRVTARAFCRRRLAFVQNTVVVGAGRIGQLVARKLLQHPEYGINVIGFVDHRPTDWNGANSGGLTHGHEYVLGRIDELPELVHQFDVDRVVFAFSELTDQVTLEALRQIADLEVQIDVVPRFFELIGPRATIYTAEGIPLIGLPPVRLSRTARVVKRTMDIVCSFLGLLVLAPLLIAAAVAIKLDSRGPVLFRQTRMGARNRPFRIFKFRTMTADAEARKAALFDRNVHARGGGDARMFKVPDDPRVTRVGRLLRRFSVDELPQLVNVLRGQMSLVGPRPIILDEDQYVDGWARRRLDVKPGITGLWQVYGGSAIPFGEMVQLDYLYVRTWSLWNDILLLFRTLPIVTRGSGC